MRMSVPVAVLSLATVFVLAAVPAAAEGGRQIKKSPLDSAVVYRDSISRDVPIRVRVFPTDNADLGTGGKKNKPKYRLIAEDMKENAPRLLVTAIVDGLKEAGFKDVEQIGEEALPAECMIVEGEFTELNPGSQGKRYMVGFGAGKSKVCASGQVVDAAGEPAMSFDHCRYEMMGIFGGGSEGQMAKDSHATGVHFVDFMAKWADGEYAR